MMRCKFTFLAAILAGFAMAGLAPPAALADFELSITVGTQSVTYDATSNAGAGLVTVVGAPTTNAINGGNFAAQTGGGYAVNTFAAPPGTNNIQVVNLQFDGYTFSATMAASNSPGSVNGANFTLSGLTITNTNSAAAILANPALGSVQIAGTNTGYVVPTGAHGIFSITLSGLGAQNVVGDTVSQTGFLDTGNRSFFTTTPPAQPTPTLTAALTTSGFALNGSTTVTPTPIPYSLTDVLTLNLASGSAIVDVSSAITVTSPAPAGLVLALTSLPCLAIGRWVRRRRQKIA